MGRILRRTRLRRAWLAPLLLFALAATTNAQPVAPSSGTSVETVNFESRLVGRRLPYKVVLPPGYDAGASTPPALYPTLYLLHGLTGHHTDWLSRTKLSGYAAQHRLIIVTPEGNDGWYTDSAGAASDKYESYIIKELIPDVERRFRASRAREGRGVAGLSMGGYGALKFGLKYPELFAFAASMSGAVGAASWRTEEDLGRSEFIRRSLVQTFGVGDTPTKRANDLFRLVRELPEGRAPALPFLYLDCGTEDPLRLLAPNAALAALLVERKVAHEYRQLPGRHDWLYWDRQVQDVLRLASDKLAAPAPAARGASAGRIGSR
jgi:S-formylglutathione hydrolase FrmB